jgi:hypothetical protein
MDDKAKVVAAAEAIGVGEQREFSPPLINLWFSDRLDLGGRQHDTPQDAFLGSLIGRYTLHEDRDVYVVTCHSKQPLYVEPEDSTDGR